MYSYCTFIGVRCALEDLYCSIELSTRLWAFLPFIYMWDYPGRYPAFSPLGFQPRSRRGVLPTIGMDIWLVHSGELWSHYRSITDHRCSGYSRLTKCLSLSDYIWWCRCRCRCLCLPKSLKLYLWLKLLCVLFFLERASNFAGLCNERSRRIRMKNK